MKQTVLFLFLFLMNITTTYAQQEKIYSPVFDHLTGFAAHEDQEKQIITELNTEIPEIDVNAGLTPDSFFYFIDEWAESRSKDNPEKVVRYRKEKIAESLIMAKEGKKNEAKRALQKAEEYGKLVEKEAAPASAKEIIQSTAAIEHALVAIAKDIPELEAQTTQGIAQEKKIVLSADVAKKIKDLCVVLAQLDPLEYAQVCKANEQSPAWLKKQDEQLTEDQKEHVKDFSENMQKCMNNPKECDCRGFGVKKLEDLCVQKKEKAVLCEKEETQDCKEDDFKPEEHLPDYLIPAYQKEMKVLLKEKESAKESDISSDCKKAGLKTQEECIKFMFETGAPKACLDAGLSGNSEADFEKCKNIMKQTQNAKRENSQKEKISFKKDCYSIENYEEKKKCFEKLSVYADSEILASAKDVCPSQEQIKEIQEKCQQYGGAPKEKKEGDCIFIDCQMSEATKQKMQEQYSAEEKYAAQNAQKKEEHIVTQSPAPPQGIPPLMVPEEEYSSQQESEKEMNEENEQKKEALQKNIEIIKKEEEQKESEKIKSEKEDIVLEENTPATQEDEESQETEGITYDGLDKANELEESLDEEENEEEIKLDETNYSEEIISNEE